MKRLALVFGTAALLLAGCSQEESIPGEDSTPNAIAFGTFVQKATKGTPVTGGYLPYGGEFLVMGNTDLVEPSPLDFMRQTVTFVQGTPDNCTYSPTKYWPASGSVNFFAVYPADIAATILPATLGEWGQPNISYTIPEDPTKQKDLMLASAPNKTSASGAVEFAFNHVLTKIGFNAQLGMGAPYDGAYVRIDSIQVGNLAAEITVAVSSGSWEMTTPGAATTNTTSYTLNYYNLVNNGAVTSSTTMTQIVEDNSYLMVAPISGITAATTASILVYYTVSYADGTSTQNTAPGTIPKESIAAGKSISVNMTITLTGITFTSGVTDWTDATDVTM